MDKHKSLNHTKSECIYQVVSIPKCLWKALYTEFRRCLGEAFRRLAEQKGSWIEEGHLLPDHVSLMIAIPPQHAVSQVVGYIKDKSVTHGAPAYGERWLCQLDLARFNHLIWAHLSY